MDGFHKTVFSREVLDFLEIKKDLWYLDGTLGDGGHTIEILKKGGKILGLDVDPESISRANNRLQEEGISSSRYILKQGNFSKLEEIINEIDPNLSFSGMVFDLGVSTLQLKTPQR